MSFDWMQAHVPASVVAAGGAKFKAQAATEIRERAALLRRLGHSKAYAELRCRRNLTWAFEVTGKPPLTDAEVRALVAEAYK